MIKSREQDLISVCNGERNGHRGQVTLCLFTLKKNQEEARREELSRASQGAVWSITVSGLVLQGVPRKALLLERTSGSQEDQNSLAIIDNWPHPRACLHCEALLFPESTTV